VDRRFGFGIASVFFGWKPQPRRSFGVFGLVAVLALLGAGEVFLRSTGALEVAIRAANQRSTADVYEAIPLLSMTVIDPLGDRTYATIRLFDRRGRLQRATSMRVMPVPDAFWVAEDHPLYVSP